MTTKQLHFKWTISRGRDTYGYNICTLLVDGEKVGKTCGGGYDMQGTVFAQWIQNNYQAELKTLFSSDIAKITDGDFNRGGARCYKGIDAFYGAFVTGTVHNLGIMLDGGCGFDCIKRIAEAIGITLKWNPESEKYKNHTYYTAIINN